MESLVSKTIKWVQDKNLQTQNPKIQLCKTIEELGELARGLNKNDVSLIKDSVGDVQVTLICLCEQLKDKGINVDYVECLGLAYEEIKDRKGKLVDGVFVKESDLSKIERCEEGCDATGR